MRQPIRIAILECDEPIGQTKEKYGGYGGVFTALLQAAAKQIAQTDDISEPRLDISAFDVVKTELYPDLAKVDAILLTGSRFNAFDNDPWMLKLVDFTKKVLKQDRVRLIGVCFGHQIIGRAMGVKVDRGDKGWEISVSPVELTSKGQQLFGLQSLYIHQMHRDIVYDYPSSVEPLGHSPTCEVQGMYSKDKLITVQGHPEFNGTIVTELLESRHEKGIFDDATFKDGMSRVQKPHDGVTVGAAFLRFLLED